MTNSHSQRHQKLPKESFKKIEKQLKENGRPLEIALFNHSFQKNPSSKETVTKVIEELRKYQNSDGGFGNAIEPDFRLPLSSPMGTSVGIRTLHSLDSYDLTKPHIQKAITYLEDSFKSFRNGWISVPKEVNDYPHTPWWHFNAETNASAIDEFWGNPAAELIGYLYYYKELIKNLDVEKLLEFCETYMKEKKVFRSEHELYCFSRLCDLLPVNKKATIRKEVLRGIKHIVILDQEKWVNYVPAPLDFVQSQYSDHFEISQEDISKHLHFFINLINKEKALLPPWGKQFYQTDLKPAYKEWIGILSLNAITKLARFGLT